MTDQTVTLDDVEVALARSKIDGALLVYIDTQEDTGRIRVNLNEGTLYDGDPEEPTMSADPLKVSMDDVMKKALDAFPESEIEQDDDGQIIINTNLTEGLNEEIVSMAKPSLDSEVVDDLSRAFRTSLKTEGIVGENVDKAIKNVEDYIADHYELF